MNEEAATPDFQNLPLEDAFAQLDTFRRALSAEDAAERFQLFGANRMEEKRAMMLLLQHSWPVCKESREDMFTLQPKQ
ncbi:hypothetical protein E2562_025916 [Oryza meyeriana var. granulata]|uniref:Cation-transporting P-type ATPase N-terminal domain-containing protein n=1 Tax=Oryza meyeriana var. granulata TaxID=110450 RepID=A0A6G1CK33_9ORYZ|nr:hypothetical protein E2562_025916 [Oryza meyeriana var. granulata]